MQFDACGGTCQDDPDAQPACHVKWYADRDCVIPSTCCIHFTDAVQDMKAVQLADSNL